MKVDLYVVITLRPANSGLHQTKRGIALVRVQNGVKHRKRKRICSSEKLFKLTFKNLRRTDIYCIIEVLNNFHSTKQARGFYSFAEIQRRRRVWYNKLCNVYRCTVHSVVYLINKHNFYLQTC